MSTEQDYRDLIKRISKIDRKAALWLMRKAPLYSKRNPAMLLWPDCLLCRTITWHNTPQGFRYWWYISDQLGENNK